MAPPRRTPQLLGETIPVQGTIRMVAKESNHGSQDFRFQGHSRTTARRRTGALNSLPARTESDRGLTYCGGHCLEGRARFCSSWMTGGRERQNRPYGPKDQETEPML